MRIGELSRRTGVSASALRFYEASGLLACAGRGENGYRHYQEEAVHAVQMIQMAQRLGFSLDELRPLLSAGRDLPREQVLASLSRRVQEIDAMQLALSRQREQALDLMGELEAAWADGRCPAVMQSPEPEQTQRRA